MIKIENVSMKFNLEIEKDFSMKQAFVNFFTKKKKKNIITSRKRNYILLLKYQAISGII